MSGGLEERVTALEKELRQLKDVVTTIVNYRRLRGALIRVGTMDLKIAAITVSNKATLLSRNLADFEKVPDLRVEDWTR